MGTGQREATSIMGIFADLFSRKPDSNTSRTERRGSADKHSSNAAVRVVGIGGCGSNTIRRMIERREEGVEYIAIDTDDAFLSRSKADRVIHIDTADSPEEAMREASSALQGADLVFVVCGLGGNTSSRIAAILARTAKGLGACTICCVYLPFLFEGMARMTKANACLARLEEDADAVMAVNNDTAVERFTAATDVGDAFEAMDAGLAACVHAVVRMLDGGFITPRRLKELLDAGSRLSAGTAAGAPDAVYDGVFRNAWTELEPSQAKSLLAYLEMGPSARGKGDAIKEQVLRSAAQGNVVFVAKENASLGSEALLMLIAVL